MDRLKQSAAILEKDREGQGYQGADPIYDNDLQNGPALPIRCACVWPCGYALQILKAAPPTASECINEGLFVDDSQNFALPHQESENPELYNPWYDLRKYQNFRISEKL